MPINVGLIGRGYWGSHLERVLTESLEFKLVCTADPMPGRGNCDVIDLLARDDVAAVVIATPASTHADLVLAALRSNKHVLVEKPLATTFDDAELCCDLADEAGLALMVDLTYVYSTGLAAVRRALAGAEVTAMWSTRAHWGGPTDVDSRWDLFPHDLSILEAVAPSWLDVAPGIETIGDAEEGTVWLGWPDRRAVIEYSRRSMDKVRRISFSTLDGLRVRWIDWPVPRVFVERPAHDEIEEVPIGAGESLAAMVAAFAAMVRDGAPSPSAGRATLRALDVIERIGAR